MAKALANLLRKILAQNYFNRIVPTLDPIPQIRHPVLGAWKLLTGGQPPRNGGFFVPSFGGVRVAVTPRPVQ